MRIVSRALTVVLVARSDRGLDALGVAQPQLPLVLLHILEELHGERAPRRGQRGEGMSSEQSQIRGTSVRRSSSETNLFEVAVVGLVALVLEDRDRFVLGEASEARVEQVDAIAVVADEALVEERRGGGVV